MQAVRARVATLIILSAVPSFVLLAVVSPAANGQEAQRSFPDALFGVKLGSLHQLIKGEKPDDVGTLPIAEFKGANQFLGNGVHYYFRPQKEYTAFKYIEKREKPTDEYFPTSFRLYLLPVIPKNASSPKDLEPHLLKWEVVVVEWSEDDEKGKDGAYYWASDFCKSLAIDLARKADIVNHYESKLYSCTFTEKESELKAHSLSGTKYFSLHYIGPVFDRKNDAVDSVIRKLRMNAIRPY